MLDEAWTGLDQAARGALDAAVAERMADGGTVMFVDHDQARLAGRISGAAPRRPRDALLRRQEAPRRGQRVRRRAAAGAVEYRLIVKAASRRWGRARAGRHWA